MRKRGGNKIIPPTQFAELKRIIELVDRSPETRENLVHNLRARVFGGVYEVSAECVAEKILQHGIYIVSSLK